jgi:CCR4-NOT transcription complex subunit 3
MSSILKAGLPQQQRPTTLTPIRYSAAAAGATQHVNSAASPSTIAATTTTMSTLTNPTPTITGTPSQPPAPSITTTTSSTQDQLSRVSSSPSLTHPSVTSPMLSSASAANLDDSLYSMDGSPSPMVSEGQANAATTSPHVPPKIGESPLLRFHNRVSSSLHRRLNRNSTRNTTFTKAECERSLSCRGPPVIVPRVNH